MMSARDLQVLKLAATGAAAKVIAGELGITQRTVEWHLERARRDLGADSTMGAVYLLAKRRVKIPAMRGAVPIASLWGGPLFTELRLPRSGALRDQGRRKV